MAGRNCRFDYHCGSWAVAAPAVRECRWAVEHRQPVSSCFFQPRRQPIRPSPTCVSSEVEIDYIAAAVSCRTADRFESHFPYRFKFDIGCKFSRDSYSHDAWILSSAMRGDKGRVKSRR